MTELVADASVHRGEESQAKSRHSRNVGVAGTPSEREGGDVRRAEALRDRVELADLLLLLLALLRLELLDPRLVELRVALEARVFRNPVLSAGGSAQRRTA